MKLKKILVPIISAVMLCITSFSANAALYVASYDTNNDGKVNVSDVAYLNRVLLATVNPSNVDRLDVNDNGVVDDIDLLTVLYYIQGKEVVFQVK